MVDAVSASGSVGAGQQFPSDSDSDNSVYRFMAKQLINLIDTAKLVKVTAVHPGTGSPPMAGTVDVQILVNLLDGSGNSTPQGIVSGMPFFRLGAGKWGVVLDPVVGDIGLAIASDRDISNVKAAVTGGRSAQVNPGSFRKYDISDGLYFGSFMGAAPSQYFWLKPDGTFVIADGPGNMIVSSAAGIAVTTAAGGDFTVNGISVTKHTHAVAGVAPGSGMVETGLPVG